jgi:chaperonin GroES
MSKYGASNSRALSVDIPEIDAPSKLFIKVILPDELSEVKENIPKNIPTDPAMVRHQEESLDRLVARTREAATQEAHRFSALPHRMVTAPMCYIGCLRNCVSLLFPISFEYQEIVMNLRPLHDRVLVKRLEEQETKRGGIIIPDSAKEKPQHAEVVAVGSGKLLEDGNRAAPDVKAGDKILFGKYSGSDIRIDGDEYLILREDEILGVFGNE